MSFEDASPDAGEVSGAYDGPDTSGDTGFEPEQPADEAPPRQYIEVDDPDNRYDRVKVDGEEIEVPYSELKRGYSREADYTRKAMALAEQRKEVEFAVNLQRALQANPEMTLQILAQQHGINFGAPPQAPPEADDDDVYVDPLERSIAQERQAREALQARLDQREADEQLRNTIEGLRTEYSLSDEDLQEVVQTAYQQGFGINQLPMVWKMMAFDRITARVRAAQDRQRGNEADDQRRQTARQAAGQVITPGGGGANGLTDRRPPDGTMSLRDAIEAAFEEHEGRR